MYISASAALSSADRPCSYPGPDKLEFSSALAGGPKAHHLPLSRTQFLPLSNRTSDPGCCSLEEGGLLA